MFGKRFLVHPAHPRLEITVFKDLSVFPSGSALVSDIDGDIDVDKYFGQREDQIKS